MNHPEIDQCMVAEDYVSGRLSAAEVESFEEHYLSCSACIKAIKDAERLQRGLSTVAAEDLVVRQAFLATAWRALRSRSGVALATMLLAVALPAGFVWQHVGRLAADLDAAKHELAEERRPRINTPILAFEATRAGDQPLQQISLLAEPEWIVLVVELGENARPRYEAKLASSDGALVWESQGLEPSFRGSLTISMNSSLLPPGKYLLSLMGKGHHLSFPLQIVEL